MKKIVAIDHGNRGTKSCSALSTSLPGEKGKLICINFASSFIDSTIQGSHGGDRLDFNGKEYTLVDCRFYQKDDKTADDDYFLLTLFAIGKQVLADLNCYKEMVQDGYVEIDLLVGVPPMHKKEIGAKFAKYFQREGKQISFRINDTPMIIKITNVHVYPQGVATTALNHLWAIVDSRDTVNIVDIGGYTVDCIRINNGQPDIVESLYIGVNILLDEVNSRINAKIGKRMTDSNIEGIIQKKAKSLNGCSNERQALVFDLTQKLTVKLLAAVSQQGIDLREDYTIFVGGGAIALKKYILDTGMIGDAYFEDDIFANAKGYLAAYNQMSKKA